jgi:topoisomerase IA-like protein
MSNGAGDCGRKGWRVEGCERYRDSFDYAQDRLLALERCAQDDSGKQTTAKNRQRKQTTATARAAAKTAAKATARAAAKANTEILAAPE